MTDNRNTILAVILSGLVLIAWQYFYNVPQMEKQRAQSRPRAELAEADAPQATAGSTTPQAGAAPSANAPRATSRPRPRPSSAATPRSPRRRASRSTPRA